MTINMNVETGIHYGFINLNSVDPDSSQVVFNEGTNLSYQEALADAQRENIDEDEFNEGYESCGEDLYFYEENEYKITNSPDLNCFAVESSPYYTYSEPYAPCCPPNAGNLNHPHMEGFKTYCLGHDWFEDYMAPYPVYCVNTDSPVIPMIDRKPCETCTGKGFDTTERIAFQRGVAVADIVQLIRNGELHVRDFNEGNNTFRCFQCDGKGVIKTPSVLIIE